MTGTDPATIIAVLVIVVALLVGPFAALRAVSHYRAKRRPPSGSIPADGSESKAEPAKVADQQADQDGEKDPDKPDGFW